MSKGKGSTIWRRSDGSWANKQNDANSHSYSQRGIDKAPGVCGGDACIRHTRIPVWALVQLRQLGTDEADLLRTYPTLTADDLVNAWSYYQSYTEEIDQQIADNELA